MSILQTSIKLELINTLINCNFKNLSVMPYDFSLSKFNKAILVNVFNSQYAIYLCNHNYLNAIDHNYSSELLADDLILALFENYIQDDLIKLNEFLDNTIDIQEYCTLDELSNFSYQISLSYIDKNQIKLDFILFIKDYNAALNLVMQLKKKQDLACKVISDKIIKCNINASCVLLSYNDLKNMEAKDVILLDNNDIKQDKVWLEVKNLRAFATIDHMSIVFDGALEIFNDNYEANMSENSSNTNNPIELNELKLNAKIVVDTLNLSLGDLEQIKQGSVLKLNKLNFDDVALEVQGQCLAKGRLIEIDNTIAFMVNTVLNKV